MTLRILITGAGGPSAVSLLTSLARADHRLFAADIDPYASGLYLVPRSCRRILPRGDAPEFGDALASLCAENEIDVLIPTVDAELPSIAERAEGLAALGTRTVVASAQAIRTCLDKAELVDALRGIVPVPRSTVIDDRRSDAAFTGRWVAKPRRGSGSRGILHGEDARGRSQVPTDGSYLVQEYLPGEEYSVDVLCDATGRFVAGVPRIRLRVDSGIAIAAQTVDDPELVAIARRAAEALGLAYVSNVQLRRDALGVPKLLEINPRFPGTMPLTIAAGVDMPALALDAALGRRLPAGPLPYRSIAMVRTQREHFVDVAEFDSTAAQSTALASASTGG